MNVYLISFTSRTGVVTRVDLQNFFDTKPEILNWYGIMPEAILVATNEPTVNIQTMLISKFGNDLTFILTKTEPNLTSGYINQEVWDFINKPKSSGKHGLSGLLGNGYNK